MRPPIDEVARALADRYDIERELGRGGMATVHLARDRKHDRLVAIKVLNPELGAMLGAERFLAEIKVTATLQHPNLLPLFDSGEVNGLLYYVMPYLEGETLRARLQREQQLPIEDAVRIATGIAHALSYAHARNVVHRDLKPENVLLQHGQPVVLDFGIALAMRNAGGTRMTQTGVSIGTPQYMSPEQAAGEKLVDARSDIFALGALLYEMLAGETPHTGPTAQIVIAKVMSGDVPPVTRMRPSVPTHIVHAVHKALSRVPADRFANADEFIRALQTPVTTGDTTISSSSRVTSGSSSSGRRTVLVGVAVAALAGVGAWGWLRPAPAVHDNIYLSAELPSDAKPNVNSVVAVAPDGRSIVYEASVNGQMVLLHRELDSDSTHVIQGSSRRYSTEVRTVGFMPDGSTLLVAMWPSEVSSLLPLDGGTARNVRWPGVGMVRRDGAALFSKADTIWFGRDTSTLKVVYRPDSARGRLPIHNLRLLPSGEVAIGWLTREGRRELALLHLDDGSAEPLGIEGYAPHVVDRDILLYYRDGGELFAIPFSLRAMRATGSAVRIASQVRERASGEPDFDVSPDGTLALSRSAIRSSLGEPIVVDRLGRVRRLPGARVVGADPRLSPDGRRLLLNNNVGFKDGFVVKDMQSGAVDTRGSDVNGGRAEWFRDGHSIVYRRGQRTLVLRDWDKVGVDSILLTSSGDPIGEVVLPANGRLAIVREGGKLSFAPVNRLDSLTTLQSAASSTAPNISPDGKLVAYNLTTTMGRNVFVQPIAAGSRAAQISADGGSEPIWSRDGRTLYYRGLDWVFAARLSPTLEVSHLDTLFALPSTLRPASISPRRTWEMLPDESGFVMLENPPIRGYSIVRGWERMLQERQR